MSNGRLPPKLFHSLSQDQRKILKESRTNELVVYKKNSDTQRDRKQDSGRKGDRPIRDKQTNPKKKGLGMRMWSHVKRNGQVMFENFLMKLLTESFNQVQNKSELFFLDPKGNKRDPTHMEMLKSLSDSQMKMFKLESREFSNEIFGTEMVKLKLRSKGKNVDVNTYNTGLFSVEIQGSTTTPQSYALEWQDMLLASLYSTVYDEYRFLGKFRLVYRSLFRLNETQKDNTTNTYVGTRIPMNGGVLDYVSAPTILQTSYLNVLMYDTFKFFEPLNLTSQEHVWNGSVLGQPSTEWWDTDLTITPLQTPVCYYLMITFNQVSCSGFFPNLTNPYPAVGFCMYEDVEFEFRQVGK